MAIARRCSKRSSIALKRRIDTLSLATTRDTLSRITRNPTTVTPSPATDTLRARRRPAISLLRPTIVGGAKRLLKNPTTENLHCFRVWILRLRRIVEITDPLGCGPFGCLLRCSSVAGETPLPRPASQANKMTRSFPSRSISTVSQSEMSEYKL